MKEALGDIAYDNYLKAKQAEFTLYSAQVSEWELQRYTPIL